MCDALVICSGCSPASCLTAGKASMRYGIGVYYLATN